MPNNAIKLDKVETACLRSLGLIEKKVIRRWRWYFARYIDTG